MVQLPEEPRRCWFWAVPSVVPSGGTPERFGSIEVQANPRIARGEEPVLHHLSPQRVKDGIGATIPSASVEVALGHLASGDRWPIGCVDEEQLVRFDDPQE